jgi:hypothetical protein
MYIRVIDLCTIQIDSMKYFRYSFFWLCFSIIVFAASAQPKNSLSVNLTCQATAYPFGKFIGMFNRPFHPGVELGWSKTIRTQPRREWFREFKAGYFYHRFVQHGIPLYMQYGMRYKIVERFQLSAALGAGYFNSIPATAVFKLNDNGDYVKAKGIGRPQAMAAFTLSTSFRINADVSKPVLLQWQYQQRMQMPFVRSYVPLLPYVQMALGFSFPFNKYEK